MPLTARAGRVRSDIIDGFVKSEVSRPRAGLPGKELFNYIVLLDPAYKAGRARALPVIANEVKHSLCL